MNGDKYLVYYYLDPYSERPFYGEYVEGLENALRPNTKFNFRFYISPMEVDYNGFVYKKLREEHA